jgi:anti-sigma factor RsiW
MMTGISEGMADARALWRMWKAADSGSNAPWAPDNLTLAAFAEDALAVAERDEVAAFLADHPELAADVAAAAAPTAVDASNASLESIIARAASLVAAPADGVVPFRAPPFRAPPSRAPLQAGPRKSVARGTSWAFAARWGSLAASIAMVGWLGFALGNDAYGSLAALELRANASTGVADELLDPPAGVFDLSEASGT